MHRVEFWLDRRAYHVRERHAECTAKHEVRHDAQGGQKKSETEKKNRQREPFYAAQISGDFRLWRRINRLKKPLAEYSVINNGPGNEPTKTLRSINLAPPFRGAGWAEKDQMFKAEQRFRFAVAVLLFQKRPQRKTAMMPHDRGWAESNHATGLLEPPAKIDIVAGFVIFGIKKPATMSIFA